jgi:hypothetical protein
MSDSAKKQTLTLMLKKVRLWGDSVAKLDFERIFDVRL